METHAAFFKWSGIVRFSMRALFQFQFHWSWSNELKPSIQWSLYWSSLEQIILDSLGDCAACAQQTWKTDRFSQLHAGWYRKNRPEKKSCGMLPGVAVLTMVTCVTCVTCTAKPRILWMVAKSCTSWWFIHVYPMIYKLSTIPGQYDIPITRATWISQNRPPTSGRFRLVIPRKTALFGGNGGENHHAICWVFP